MVKEYGYEYESLIDIKLWSQVKNKSSKGEKYLGAYCLRSGRDALKVVASSYPGSIVYMPSLACDTMVSPFVLNDCKIKYYKLNPDYSIDLDHLSKILESSEEKNIFVYMHYFGRKSISDKNLEVIKKTYSNTIFVEDITHIFLSKPFQLFTADYTVASVRKWANIPDGGLIWSKHLINEDIFLENNTFCGLRLKAQEMKMQYMDTGNYILKQQYRKMFSNIYELLDKDKYPTLMSKYSLELLRKIIWNDIKIKREHNSKIIIDILQKNGIELIQKHSGLSDLYVPFKTLNRDCVQKELSQIGIYNTIIWPISERQKSICQTAKNTTECMLAAPCDQRYEEHDMLYIGNEIVNKIKKQGVLEK